LTAAEMAVMGDKPRREVRALVVQGDASASLVVVVVYS